MKTLDKSTEFSFCRSWELPDFKRWQIIGQFKSGMSQCQIVLSLRIQFSSVNYIIVKLTNERKEGSQRVSFK